MFPVSYYIAITLKTNCPLDAVIRAKDSLKTGKFTIKMCLPPS